MEFAFEVEFRQVASGVEIFDSRPVGVLGAGRGDGQCWITGCGGSLHGAVRREGRGVAAATGRRRARRAAPASGHQGPGVSPPPGATRGRRAEDLHAETRRRTPVATAGAKARWRGRIKQEKKEL